MTVQEAKKVIEDFDKCVIVKADGCYETIDYIKAKEIAIECMEEVEQYRALGTVEELKHLKEMNEDCLIKHLTGIECSYNETGCSDCIGKQALLEAMAKQIPKKPLKVKGECYSRDKEGNEGYVVLYLCPRCKSQVLVNPLPCECGQKIDWNDLSKLDWEEGGTSD